MNDFTDDSFVKFYLNRRTNDSTNGHEDDDTIKAKSSFGEGDTLQKARYLSSSTSGNLDRHPCIRPTGGYAILPYKK